MKAQLIAVIAVCLCITSALFIDPVNSAAAVSATIQTNGTINHGILPLYDSFENGLSDWQKNYIDHHIAEADTTWSYDGIYSIRVGTTSNDRYIKLTKNLKAIYPELYVSAIVKLVNWSFSNDRGAYFLSISQDDSASSYLANLGIYNINGKLTFAIQYKTAYGPQRVTSDISPAINNTYWLQLKVVIDQTIGEVTGYINGTKSLFASGFNNSIYSGNSTVEYGWMGADTGSIYENQGIAHVDCVQADTNEIKQPVYSRILAPTSLTIWTDNTYYYANSSSNTIFFGGPNKNRNVNGLSFSEVANNCCITTSKITILSGNYLLDKTINCKSNNIISGTGNTTFIQASRTIGNNSAAFLCNSVSNVSIANMWIDGNPNNHFINTFGVLTTYSNDIWIHNCIFSNYNLGTSCGIDVCWTINSVFENNYCFNIGGAGIWIDIGSSGYTVSNNVVEGNVAGTSNLGIALAFWDDDGNHKGVVKNNIITGNFTWFALEVYWGNNRNKAYGIEISNNTIFGGNERGYQSGIWLYRISNSTIKDNIIMNNTGNANNGIMLSGCDHIIITKNIIQNNNGKAIYVSEDQEQFNVITGNDLKYNLEGIFDNTEKTKDDIHDNTY